MNQIFSNKRLFKYLFWIWLLVIFTLSSLPNIPTQKINIWDEPFRLDYLEHFGVFGILGGFFVIWKYDFEKGFSIKKEVWSLIAIIIFACLDEIHQIWIPGRTFNVLDLIYNITGLLAAYTIGPFFVRWVQKK